MPVQFPAFDDLYLERLRAGDNSTEEHFVAYFSRFLRRKLGRRLRCPSAIDDVRQETFSRVWRALRTEHGIRRPERLGAFVNSVCNNVLREYHRKAFKEAPREDDAVANIPDGAIDAEDLVARRQIQCQVGRIIGKLPVKHRELIRRAFIEECDRNELCRDFGVNRTHLRILLHRSKQQFRSSYLKGAQTPAHPTYSQSP
jgi:RNA polymerase sigma-70 factor (ECF subfamily)